jgi:hypothetical protein
VRERFWSTADVEPERVLVRWTEILHRALPGVVIYTMHGTRPGAQLRQTRLGPIHLSVADAFEQVIELGSATALTSAATYYLLQLHDGGFAVQADGRTRFVQARECLLLNNKTSYRLEFGHTWRCRILRLPGSWLCRWLPDPDGATLSPLPADHGWGSALSHTVASLDPAATGELPLPGMRIAELIAGLLARAATCRLRTAP